VIALQVEYYSNSKTLRPKMEKSPLVSIIIPCYNREAYIPDAINSCLNQTYQNIEIIVVDDGSTDSSVEILKRYGDDISLITQSNQGVSAARNKGLKSASGEYIVMLDSDDWLSHDIIQKHIETHMKWPEIAISCADSASVDISGKESQIKPCNWPSEPSVPLELFMLSPPPFPACEMYKASVMKQLGGYFEDLRAFADSSLRLRIILNNHKVVSTLGGHAIYRPVANSITRNRIKLHSNGMKLNKKLKKEFRNSPQITSLIKERTEKQRIRYWLATLAFHTSYKPASIAKFIWHLMKVTKVDITYPLFIIRSKPWTKTRKDAF
jgi:glycosyltransferase involved in cell wall biosynthesis